MLFRSYRDSSGTGHYVNPPAGQFTTNKWYFVAFVLNKSNITLYINDTKYYNLSNLNLDNYQQQVLIGKALSSGSFLLNGSMDEVMIFNRSLSALEVQNIYNLGRGLQEYNSNGLVAY